jgi:hypothetical protein
VVLCALFFRRHELHGVSHTAHAAKETVSRATEHKSHVFVIALSLAMIYKRI